MDQVLTCSGPENLAGVLFQRAELDQCLKPNVLLRCDATGFPTPTLFWTRADGTA
ncbi:hypothetical protein M9458_028281, partial [Cirrhinus mrigala]